MRWNLDWPGLAQHPSGKKKVTGLRSLGYAVFSCSTITRSSMDASSDASITAKATRRRRSPRRKKLFMR